MTDEEFFAREIAPALRTLARKITERRITLMAGPGAGGTTTNYAIFGDSAEPSEADLEALRGYCLRLRLLPIERMSG